MSEEIKIDKTKTISDDDMKFFRNAHKIKMNNSRLPRENILLHRLYTGEITENGESKEET